MSYFDPLDTFVSMFNTKFTHTNVVGLTGDPLIKTYEEYVRTGGDVSNGLLVIYGFSDDILEDASDSETRRYISEATLIYPNNETTLEAILGELERAINDQNDDVTRTEYYQVTKTFDRATYIRGQFSLEIQIDRTMVAKTV